MTESCPVCGSTLPTNSAACPACGFKLQGSTQSFQPITLDEDVPAVEHEPAPSHATMRVVRGPQTGVVFDLGDEPLSIGRNPQCGLFLNDMTVSRQHAELVPVNGGWVIKDCNSFNGVWINNKSIDEHALKPGDIVQIGAFCLQYQDE